MKHFARFVIALGFLFSLPILNAYAQSGFEGTLTWSMALPSMKQFDEIINVKGDKSEIEMNMGAYGTSQMWGDRTTGKIYMYLSSLKKGMILDMNDLTNTKMDSLDITPTGRKETISGYAAEEYLQKTSKGEIYIWFTTGLPKDVQYACLSLFRNSARQDPKLAAFVMRFMDKGLAPVRIEMINDGKSAMRMQFEIFERKSLADALFVPPSNLSFEAPPSGVGSGLK